MNYKRDLEILRMQFLDKKYSLIFDNLLAFTESTSDGKNTRVMKLMNEFLGKQTLQEDTSLSRAISAPLKETLPSHESKAVAIPNFIPKITNDANSSEINSNRTRVQPKRASLPERLNTVFGIEEQRNKNGCKPEKCPNCPQLIKCKPERHLACHDRVPPGRYPCRECSYSTDSSRHIMTHVSLHRMLASPKLVIPDEDFIEHQIIEDTKPDRAELSLPEWNEGTTSKKLRRSGRNRRTSFSKFFAKADDDEEDARTNSSYQDGSDHAPPETNDGNRSDEEKGNEADTKHTLLKNEETTRYSEKTASEDEPLSVSSSCVEGRDSILRTLLQRPPTLQQHQPQQQQQQQEQQPQQQQPQQLKLEEAIHADDNNLNVDNEVSTSDPEKATASNDADDNNLNVDNEESTSDPGKAPASEDADDNNLNVDNEDSTGDPGKATASEGVGRSRSTKKRKTPLQSQCPHCPYRSNNSYPMKSHLDNHDRVPPGFYQCRQCSYSINSMSRMVDHENLHGKSSEPSNQTFRCLKCPYVASWYRHLEAHMAFHDSRPSVPKNNTNMDNEETTRGPETTTATKYPAKQDGAACFTKRPRCPNCPYLYTTLNGMKRHLVNHDRVPPGDYRCRECNYSTNKYDVHQRHIKLHRISDGINSSFDQSVSTAADSSSSSITADPSAKSKHKCPHCHVTLMSVASLESHLACHDRVPPGKYECRECSYSTDSALFYRNHEAIHYKRAKTRRGKPSVAQSTGVKKRLKKTKNVT